MRKADRTRQFILEKTAPLFNKKGFEGTSLSDLEKVTGLSKGSLYGNFKGKKEIGEAAFKYAIGKVHELVRLKLQGALTAKEKLTALLDFYAEYVFNPPVPGGCPLLNTAVEVDDEYPSMRRVVAKELMNTIHFISSLLEEGIGHGEFRKDIKPNELAYIFFCAVEGALMFSRAERSREPMDIIVKHCKTTLEKISDR